MAPSEIIKKKTDKYGDLIPISKADYDALKDSISKDGCLHYPIIVNESGDVLDGHNRLKICQELNIEPRFETKHFDNELDEIGFVYSINLKRRHLDYFQRAELALKAKADLEQVARENMSLAAAGKGKDSKGKGVKSFTPLKRVNEKLAKELDMSHMQIHKLQTIIEKAPEELKLKVRTGKTSIARAYKQVKHSEREEDRVKPKPALPEGEYDVILADPPWTYDINLRGSPDEHYRVMKTEEIMDLDIPAADNAVLFLWATAPNLNEAQRVMIA